MIDFTIVTASYNYGQFIEECLQSVAGQEGVTLEHLVMDAGSTDDTSEVVGRFPHATFFQEPDKGMSDGINKGFLKAQGKWVMWLNADDLLLPGALAEVKRFAEQKEDADVIFGGWNFIDRDGEFIRRMTLFPFRPAILYNHGCYLGSTSTFYKRETTISEGYILNENFKCVMDGEYFSRLSKAGKKFEYLPCVLANFRVHDESISRKHIGRSGIDEVLELQKQYAESRSIRRTYGVKLFGDEMLNGIVEGILANVYRFQKGVLKWIHKGSCREPE